MTARLGPLDAAEAESRLKSLFPELAVASVKAAGEGLGHAAFLVNDEWLFRFAKNRAISDFEREVALLVSLHGLVGVDAPLPVYVNSGQQVMGYRKVRGRPLIDCPPPAGEALSALLDQLAKVLQWVHGLTRDTVGPQIVDEGDTLEWWTESRGMFQNIEDDLSGEDRALVAKFFASEPSIDGADLVFCHNDFSIEHILVDSGMQMTGLIDWSEAAFADPANDFGKLARDLGVRSLDWLLHSYPHSSDKAALRSRALIIAKCALIEDLFYGLQTGEAKYSAKSLARLKEIFTAP